MLMLRLPVKSNEHGSASSAGTDSVTQQIHHILSNPSVRYRVHRKYATGLHPDLLKPAHTFIHDVTKFLLNVKLPSTPVSLEQFFSLLSDSTTTYFSQIQRSLNIYINIRSYTCVAMRFGSGVT